MVQIPNPIAANLTRAVNTPESAQTRPPRVNRDDANSRPAFDPAQGGDAAENAALASARTQSREARPAALDNGIDFPHLRRKTDAGKAADPAAIDLPPHLERRRSWREARGLNVFHAQSLGQKDDLPADSETVSAAHRQYRQFSGRGRLDLDLAQRVSVTV